MGTVTVQQQAEGVCLIEFPEVSAEGQAERMASL